MANTYGSAVSFASRLSSLAPVAYRGQRVAGGEDYAAFVPREASVEEALKCSSYLNALRYRSAAIGKLIFSSTDPYIDKLLERPNPAQSRYSFFYSVCFDLSSYGVSYIFRDNSLSGDNRPIALYPFAPPELQYHVRDGKEYYLQSRWRTNELLPAEQVIKIEEMPRTQLQVSSNLYATWPLICAWREAMSRLLAVMRNDVTATKFISSPGVLSDEAKNNAREWLRNNKGRRAPDEGTPLILDGGATISALEYSQNEALPKFVDTLNEMIAASLGVPSYITSGRANTKFNNMEATVTISHADVIEPLAVLIALELSAKLGVNVKANTNEILLGSPADRVDMLTKMGTFATTNEQRRTAELWQLGEFPQLEGDVYNRVPKLTEARSELEIERESKRISHDVARLRERRIQIDEDQSDNPFLT